jgi:hypothetical protein
MTFVYLIGKLRRLCYVIETSNSKPQISHLQALSKQRQISENRKKFVSSLDKLLKLGALR